MNYGLVENTKHLIRHLDTLPYLQLIVLFACIVNFKSWANNTFIVDKIAIESSKMIGILNKLRCMLLTDEQLLLKNTHLLEHMDYMFLPGLAKTRDFLIPV